MPITLTPTKDGAFTHYSVKIPSSSCEALQIYSLPLVSTGQCALNEALMCPTDIHKTIKDALAGTTNVPTTLTETNWSEQFQPGFFYAVTEALENHYESKPRLLGLYIESEGPWKLLIENEAGCFSYEVPAGSVNAEPQQIWIDSDGQGTVNDLVFTDLLDIPSKA